MTAYDKIADFFREPDYLKMCAFGLPILLQRNMQKAWCGYVGIPPAHPHFGLSYSADIQYHNISNVKVGGQSPLSLFCYSVGENTTTVPLDCLYDCPGGITWAEDRTPSEKPDGNWWFGFDCAHYNDYTPMNALYELRYNDPYHPGTYRNMQYALAGAVQLANQLTDFTSAYPEVL